jgi:MobA/MobL family
MAVYHVHASYIKRGVGGGASGFRQYLAREEGDQARQFSRYIDREDGRGTDDLVAQGHANLPQWAQGSAGRFWQAADTLERKNGIVARHLEIALPRELSPQGRQDLADDIRAVTVDRYAHSWAMHEPMARDGSGIMPHVHILFSPRRPGGSEGRIFGQVASDVHLVACNCLIFLPRVDDDDTSCDAPPSLDRVAGPCRRWCTSVAETATRPARVAIGCACPA